MSFFDIITCDESLYCQGTINVAGDTQAQVKPFSNKKKKCKDKKSSMDINVERRDYSNPCKNMSAEKAENSNMYDNSNDGKTVRVRPITMIKESPIVLTNPSYVLHPNCKNSVMNKDLWTTSIFMNIYFVESIPSNNGTGEFKKTTTIPKSLIVKARKSILQSVPDTNEDEIKFQLTHEFKGKSEIFDSEISFYLITAFRHYQNVSN